MDSKEQALLIVCPVCGARPGWPCKHLTSYMRNSELKRPHRDRVAAARDLLKEEV